MSTQSKPGILAFVDRYDRESVQALSHAGAKVWGQETGVPMGGAPRPATLIAVGLEGGAELAQWVGTPACSGCRSHVECLDDLGAPCDCPCHFPELRGHGLDGVRGIGLVGVTAPWAERVIRFQSEPARSMSTRLPLGPLEPLRAVADMARNITCEKWRYDTHELCTQPATHILDHAFMPKAQRVCTKHGEGEWNGSVLKPFVPIRLIIACAPDDGVCAACNGYGVHNPGWPIARRCGGCGGSGKALSSANVARELGLDPMAGVAVGGSGGLIYLNHTTRAALSEHGILAALELAVKE